MKTDALVAALARGAGAVDPGAEDRRVLALHALAAALCVTAVALVLGARPDWRQALASPMDWVKLAFPASTAVAAFVVLRRLGHPGMRLGTAPLAVASPFALVWLLALVVLASSPRTDRLRLLLGSSWQSCVPAITAFAVPAFIVSVHALRRLAPTRLRLAGAACGLYAGAAAAFAYAFACPETQAPFLAVWYALGMLTPAGIGALLGPRLLRW